MTRCSTASTRSCRRGRPSTRSTRAGRTRPSRRTRGGAEAAVDYLDVADRMWPVLGPAMRGHAWLYRATGGRLGGNLPGLPPLLLLDHVGARSGTRRTTPLVYMPVGEDLLVVASKGGHPRDPPWMHN